MDIQDKIEQIMNQFGDYTEGVRVQLLINRSIINSNKGSKRWVNKLISTNREEFKDNIERLLNQQYYINDPSIRLYSCLNSRKLDKSIKHFHHKMIDISTDEEKHNFYLNLNAKFVSCLMQPENKEENKFLIDVDTKDEEKISGFEGFMAGFMISTEMKLVKRHSLWLKYETPNGFHYITNAFNPASMNVYSLMEDKVSYEIKKDGLLLLNTLS